MTKSDAAAYTVETIDNAWSYIIGPNGYREGPIRYRWEAEEWAKEMNNGKPPPAEEMRVHGEEQRR